MFALLGLHFTGSFDLTAIGTILLALATFISTRVSYRALESARKATKASQEATEVAREEVEAAHLPVVVPLVDRRRMELGRLGTTERRPGVADRHLLVVPVENIGPGPALDLRAHAIRLGAGGEPFPGQENIQASAEIAGLGTGSFAALEIEVSGWGPEVDFELTVTYESVARKRRETRARWNAAGHRYEDVGVEPARDNA